MQVPSVVDESLIQLFKYWREGVQQGGYYSNELYTCARSFSQAERLKGYEIAFEYAEQGKKVLISSSPKGYKIWLCLRSPNDVAVQSLAACKQRAKQRATAKPLQVAKV